jgi:16S rRNA (guanine527-N7)-methyltransferase
MTPRAALERGLGELALALPSGALEQLLAYTALLGKWNRVHNLTSIRDPLQMVSHHLLDSLSALPHLPLPDGARLADIGSGAGLPGIPLAIARADCAVVLNDSSQKKAAFMRQAIIELGLRNAQVHEGRAQSWHPAERFAVVISRAFAELAAFAKACRHLLAEGGVLAAMKGVYPRDELERLPPGTRCDAVELHVPLLAAQRHLALCRVEG